MFDKDLITGSGRGGPSLSAQPRADGESGTLWGAADFVSPVPRWKLEEPENPDDVAIAVQSCFVGIMWAGAAFVASLFLVSLFVILFSSLKEIGANPECWQNIFDFFVLSIPASLFGFFVAAISGSMSIGWVLALSAMFSGLMSRRLAVALAGGMAAFLPIWAIGFLFLVDPRVGVNPLSIEFFVVDNLYPAALLILFTLSAMLFGQVGALRAARLKGVWRNLKQEMEYQRSQRLQANQSGRKSSVPTGIMSPFQFRIRHLMIGMIVCSCLFALDQIFPNHALLAITALYIFLQSILLCFDIVFFRWYRSRLLRE